MFNKTDNLLTTPHELQAHVDTIPQAQKHPLHWGNPPKMIGHASAIIVDDAYVGDCGKDYHLLQHSAAFDPLIATLKDHRFTARPWKGSNGAIRGFLVRLDDVSVTFPGRSKPTFATMRVANSILPGTSLQIRFGIFELLCSNGLHVGAMQGVEIAHNQKMKDKLAQFESAVERAPQVIEVYRHFLETLPSSRMTVEETVSWLVGIGFPVRDVVSAISETQSHLFGEQQDQYREVGWNPRTLLDVATHIVSNPPPKSDGEVRVVSADTQWKKLAAIERGIKTERNIGLAISVGRQEIKEAESDSALATRIAPLIRRA